MGRLLATLLLALAGSAAFWYELGRPRDVPGGLAPDARLQCVSYTPFRGDETPADFRVERAELEQDFALLATQAACVRIYSMRGMELVPEVAREYGLGVIAGAWVNREEQDTERELQQLVGMANAYPDVVRAVLVGNEVLLRRERTAAQMLGYLARVKAQVAQPVSYGDVWEFWLQNPSIASGVDFMTIHLLPYWENDPTPVDRAVEAVAHAHATIAARFPGKAILIGETGWPSEGRRREGAQPGRANEALFIRAVVERAHADGWHYNLIEAFDQPWKRAQEGAVGGYWGLFDAARQEKGMLRGPVSDLPRWRECLAVAVAAWAAAVLLLRLRAPLALLLVAAGANGVVLHLHQMTLYSRGLTEDLWFLLVAAASVACALLLARGLQGRAAPRWQDSALLLALALAAVEMLGLVFDARYRHFPVAVFVVPALAVLALGWQQRAQAERGRVLGLLMLAGAAPVLWQETLLNVEALGWVAVAALYGAASLGVRARVPGIVSTASASSASTVAGAPSRTL